MSDLCATAARYITTANSIPFTLRQVAILGLIADRPGIGAKEAARMLNVSKPVITRCSDYLIELGLITRVRAETDRRKVLLRATDAGYAHRSLMSGRIAA